MVTRTTEPTTRTIEVPGATLTYDVRPNASTERPPLFLIGSPMGAAGFGTLANLLRERTIVTYDPRGAERSQIVFPVIVGAGRRLFADSAVATGLALHGSRTTPSGVTISVYRPTGRPEFGEVEVS